MSKKCYQLHFKFFQKTLKGTPMPVTFVMKSLTWADHDQDYNAQHFITFILNNQRKKSLWV